MVIKFYGLSQNHLDVLIKDALTLLAGIIGRQKQRAKCWHTRSKFEQNMLN